MKFLSSAALAASLALAVPALAATAPTSGAATPSTPAASNAAPTTAAPSTGAAQSGAPAASAAGAGVNASAAVGMPVRDSTGAAIGQITAVGPDASGKTLATIKMGTQSFAIDVSSLAIQGGAATINATKAQILAQMPKS